VTAALRRVRGVTYASVSPRKDEATVIRQKGKACDSELVAAVRRAGYSASVIPVRSVTLSVTNMDCRGCPERVQSALRRVPGVRKVEVKSRSLAQVDYDQRRVDRTKLIAAVRRAGFQAQTVTTTASARTTSTRTAARTAARQSSVYPGDGRR
jgi:copper chaperone CopZ